MFLLLGLFLLVIGHIYIYIYICVCVYIYIYIEMKCTYWHSIDGSNTSPL